MRSTWLSVKGCQRCSWPRRLGCGPRAKTGTPGLQGLPTVPRVKAALPRLLCSYLLWDSGSRSLGLFPCSSSSPDLLSAVSLPLHLTPSCCSLGFQLWCHLLLEAFPDYLAPSLRQGAASVACMLLLSPSSSYHAPLLLSVPWSSCLTGCGLVEGQAWVMPSPQLWHRGHSKW